MLVNRPSGVASDGTANQRLRYARSLSEPATGINFMERREEQMTKTFSLCPACSQCPAVEIDANEVRIGERENLVRLSPAEWNVLVQAIKDGELEKVAEE